MATELTVLEDFSLVLNCQPMQFIHQLQREFLQGCLVSVYRTSLTGTFSATDQTPTNYAVRIWPKQAFTSSSLHFVEFAGHIQTTGTGQSKLTGQLFHQPTPNRLFYFETFMTLSATFIPLLAIFLFNSSAHRSSFVLKVYLALFILIIGGSYSYIWLRAKQRIAHDTAQIRNLILNIATRHPVDGVLLKTIYGADAKFTTNARHGRDGTHAPDRIVFPGPPF